MSGYDREPERDGRDGRDGDREAVNEDFKCFVGGISWTLNDSKLRDVFRDFDPSDARVMTDRITGRSRGFGFVWFRNKRDQEDAIRKLHDFEIEGRKISVTPAVPQSQMKPGTPADAVRRGSYGGGRDRDSYRDRGERRSYDRRDSRYDRDDSRGYDPRGSSYHDRPPPSDRGYSSYRDSRDSRPYDDRYSDRYSDRGPSDRPSRYDSGRDSGYTRDRPSGAYGSAYRSYSPPPPPATTYGGGYGDYSRDAPPPAREKGYGGGYQPTYPDYRGSDAGAGAAGGAYDASNGNGAPVSGGYDPYAVPSRARDDRGGYGADRRDRGEYGARASGPYDRPAYSR